jgi:hypothetical protein
MNLLSCSSDRGDEAAETQQIAVGAEPVYDAGGYVGKERHMSERLTSGHVGQVYFDKRNVNRQ